MAKFKQAKTKLESEEPEKYPMCESQDAQIDCRYTSCKYYKGAGQCSNISPAITLNQNNTFVCWSRREIK